MPSGGESSVGGHKPIAGRRQEWKEAARPRSPSDWVMAGAMERSTRFKS